MPNLCHYHSLSLAPVNPDWFYLPGYTFLVPVHPGSPGRSPGGCKTVVVVVVIVVVVVVVVVEKRTWLVTSTDLSKLKGYLWS